MAKEKIGVLDFGGQYAHLIATKLRAQGILAEILDPEEKIEILREYKGLILSGSPALASFDEESRYNKEIFKEDIPILGLCFGHQEIAKYYGGKVEHREREYGKATLYTTSGSPIFEGLSKEEIVWMSHGDTVVEISKEFEEIGYSLSGGVKHSNSAIASEKLKRYGFQFHPEVDDTINGYKMLYNFAVKICNVEPNWKIDSYKEVLINRIKEEAKDRKVFLLASGGVDSTVCAVLLIKALGQERVSLLHIDNGLLRKNESDEVLELFRKMNLNENLHFKDASDTFISALKEVYEPEEKRKIIGETFVKVFEEEARKLSLDNSLLAQGTIYPDTIETKGTKRADLIKTHHNRVPLIAKMIEEGKVLEPLKELYKAEVRQLGESLGLPHKVVYRHPFPGPGLGVRLLCSKDKRVNEEERIEVQRIVDDLLKDSKIKGCVLPVKSVGVKADLRAYDFPVALWGTIAYDKIELIASKIYQKVPQVNRCAVLLYPEEIDFVEARRAFITKERLGLLREVDSIVNKILNEENWYEKIWQCPVAFVPVVINGKGEELVVIRPVYSERGMTAQPSFLDEKTRNRFKEELSKFEKISGILLDITTKPPGTIEWE